jgi:uncharacterized short protein YbdD (DUF466 family)
MRNIARMLRRLREAAHLMVGLPDYGRYVEHRLKRHPDQPILSRTEFVRDRTARRFEGGGGSRCC